MVTVLLADTTAVKLSVVSHRTAHPAESTGETQLIARNTTQQCHTAPICVWRRLHIQRKHARFFVPVNRAPPVSPTCCSSNHVTSLCKIPTNGVVTRFGHGGSENSHYCGAKEEDVDGGGAREVCGRCAQPQEAVEEDQRRGGNQNAHPMPLARAEVLGEASAAGDGAPHSSCTGQESGTPATVLSLNTKHNEQRVRSERGASTPNTTKALFLVMTSVVLVPSLQDSDTTEDELQQDDPPQPLAPPAVTRSAPPPGNFEAAGQALLSILQGADEAAESVSVYGGPGTHSADSRLTCLQQDDAMTGQNTDLLLNIIKNATGRAVQAVVLSTRCAGVDSHWKCAANLAPSRPTK